MTEIRFRVPRVPAGVASNMLGLLGLLAVTVAVGGLTGSWWWSVLVGGVLATGLAALTQAGGQAPATQVARPATGKLAAVSKAA